jgi:ecotin
VPLAGEPYLVPYNASLPIVVYAPRDLQVRWRLWKAESRLQNALPQ